MPINPKCLHLIKKKKKYIHLVLKITPQSKRATHDKTIIQEQIIEQMKQRRFEQTKGHIAIEVNIYASKRNMPNIEKQIKNLLDLLHKEEYLKNKADTIYLPFDDDRNIKYLGARYCFVDIEPVIHIYIRPFLSFISDIRFANKLIENEFEYDNGWEGYVELMNAKQGFIETLGEDGFENLRRMSLSRVQSEISKNTSISSLLIANLYPANDGYKKYFGDMAISTRFLLLKQPLRIQLNGIPVKESKAIDYKKEFKEAIKLEIQRYREKHPVMNEMQSPLVISVFYQSPKTKQEDYKDLDNIMLEYVAPAINQVYHPPVANSQAPHLKTMDGNAIGYEIIEVPRRREDDSDGFIAIGLRIEQYSEGLMSISDSAIDKYMKEHKYQERKY
jgi:hypothetical protein